MSKAKKPEFTLPKRLLPQTSLRIMMLCQEWPHSRPDLIKALDIPTARISPAIGQLSRNNYITPVPDATGPNGPFTISDKGKAILNDQLLKAPLAEHPVTVSNKSSGRVKVMPEPETQLPLPSLSVTAESLTDHIAAVIAENSHLRNALKDIRARIDVLLAAGEANVTKDD